MMKRLLIMLGIGAVVLWLVGPLHEGIGQFVQQTMNASPERPASKPSFPPPVADVQRALQAAGFDPGLVDGRTGCRTRSALQAFQSAKDLQPTGEVNAQTWDVLQVRQERESEAAEITKAAESDEALPSAGQKQEVRSAILESRLRSPERIKKVQFALKQAGFDPGPIDGELGPRTDQALRSFQRATGLEPDGIVGVKTWAALSDVLTSVTEQGRIGTLAGRD